MLNRQTLPITMMNSARTMTKYGLKIDTRTIQLAFVSPSCGGDSGTGGVTTGPGLSGGGVIFIPRVVTEEGATFSGCEDHLGGPRSGWTTAPSRETARLSRL